MQHLRAIHDTENSKRGGVDEEDDTEAVWIPSAVQPKDRAPGFSLKEDDAGKTSASSSKPTIANQHNLLLPSSVFAADEISLAQAYEEPAPQGLQPDMDPHLRQTLEALDDDAFVDDKLEDDFFTDLVQDGVWSGERTAGDEWRDQAPEGDDIWLDPLERAKKERDAVGGDESALSLEARVALFKEQQKKLAASQGDSDDAHEDEDAAADEEDRDTLGELGPSAAARRSGRRAGSVSSTGSALGKKGKPGALARRAASMREGSVGGASTAWTMTSSSMFRNEGLTDLDSQFDQVIRSYGGRATGDPELDALTGAFTDVHDGEADMDDPEADELDHETAEKLTRQDLDHILDDFLDHQEVIGGKLRPTLGDRTTSADEKLELVRKALGHAHIREGVDDENEDEEDSHAAQSAQENPFLNPDIIGRDREQWDVETIQTTKTNLENHPRTIRASDSVRGSVTDRSAAPRTVSMSSAIGGRDDRRIPKIRLHPRTGMPQVVGYTSARKPPKCERNEALGSARASSPDSDSNGHGDGDDDDDDESESADNDVGTKPLRAGASQPRGQIHRRDRNESAEERRQRKKAVKQEKQQRKQAKSAAKKAFAAERKRQTHATNRQAESRGGVAGMHLA